ncbi:hypothetical protein CRG98_015308 [Punica granatum]|uniref:Uncharacterized protein n=1 Tax=Punica granatum TaxID=22663 RepID=A0A2I0K6X2_PUNGR|nr:hypothetical protein CRG98_015308 [Punica granatum]
MANDVTLANPFLLVESKHRQEEKATELHRRNIFASFHRRPFRMSFLFGQRKTPAELLRENKRMIDKSIREIERERQGLQAQEKKLIVDIKKHAKQGQMMDGGS